MFPNVPALNGLGSKKVCRDVLCGNIPAPIVNLQNKMLSVRRKGMCRVNIMRIALMDDALDVLYDRWVNGELQ